MNLTKTKLETKRRNLLFTSLLHLISWRQNVLCCWEDWIESTSSWIQRPCKCLSLQCVFKVCVYAQSMWFCFYQHFSSSTATLLHSEDCVRSNRKSWEATGFCKGDISRCCWLFVMWPRETPEGLSWHCVQSSTSIRLMTSGWELFTKHSHCLCWGRLTTVSFVSAGCSNCAIFSLVFSKPFSFLWTAAGFWLASSVFDLMVQIFSCLITLRQPKINKMSS